MVYIEMMVSLVSKILVVLKRIELERTLLINLGKEFQQNIVCETNLKIVNVLDVTLDLTTGIIILITRQYTPIY